MARVAAATRPKVSEDTRKTKEPKVKKSPKLRAHPRTDVMVLEAIKNLADKKGSSLPAIKKYIAAHHVVDIDKQALFIRKFLKKAVESKTLVQSKGTGASGSFKLPRESKVSKKSKKSPATRGRPKKTESVPKKVPRESKVSKKSKKPPAKRGRPKKTESVPKKVKSTDSKIKTSAAPKKTAKSIRRAKAVKQPKSPKVKKSTASKTKSAAVSKSYKSKSAKK